MGNRLSLLFFHPPTSPHSHPQTRPNCTRPHTYTPSLEGSQHQPSAAQPTPSETSLSNTKLRYCTLYNSILCNFHLAQTTPHYNLPPRPSVHLHSTHINNTNTFFFFFAT